MKTLLVTLLSSTLCTASLWALPQDFGDLSDLLAGGLGLDGRDLTDGFMDPAVWSGEKELPGEWRDGYEFGPKLVKHIAAAPYLFGQVPIGVEATYDRKQLERISIYYLEVGTFFGYQPSLKATEEGQKTLREKNQAFRKVFKELKKSLTKTLETLSERREAVVEGKTQMFKHRFQQFEKGDLALQLRAKKDFYVRVDLRRKEAVTEGYLPLELAAQRKRERTAALETNVRTEADGDVIVSGIPMIYQGGRAYCGITTFLMAAQYLGVTIDPATMASVSGFRYGMGGKKMIEAYNAAAKEGRIRLNRSNKLDVDRVRESIDEGVPVLVWRRYDADRNRLHSAATQGGGTFASLPAPSASDQASWPNEGAPAHASVITGYHKERNELIFSESWGDHARGKRMRVEELEATTYYVFYFSI